MAEDYCMKFGVEIARLVELKLELKKLCEDSLMNKMQKSTKCDYCGEWIYKGNESVGHVGKNGYMNLHPACFEEVIKAEKSSEGKIPVLVEIEWRKPRHEQKI